MNQATDRIAELEWRGLVQDMTSREEIDKLPPGTAFYVGFDPTAPYLHIGNLIPLMAAAHLAKSGLKPIILFGGSTGAIGDPSGRSTERKLLDRSVIEANIASQRTKVEELYERLGVTARFVNNYDWTHDISVLDFLRDVGKHFTVNYMLAKDVVKARLDGEGISFTEFSYMLLQSFDYLHLYRNHGCRLQIGGSDQWGNITSGLELIRKKEEGGSAQALSLPLVTDSTGKKFGKSEGGAIWVDAAGTSPYRLHQFLLNTDDRDAVRYVKLLTDLPKERIDELEASVATAPEKREAQRALADRVVHNMHGPDAVEDVTRAASSFFSGQYHEIPVQMLDEVVEASGFPCSEVSARELGAMNVVDFIVASGVAPSKGEGKRLISGGGFYINNQRVEDPGSAIGSLLENPSIPKIENRLVLRSGKKNFRLVKLRTESDA